MNSKVATTARPSSAIGDSLYGEILGKVVFVEDIARISARSSGRDSCNRVLVLCDHASNRVPPMLGYVSPKILLDHYGWDIGALPVSRFLAQKLASPLIYSNFSRLLIDPNRCEEATDLIREDLSIPLNADMDKAKRAERISLFYAPYHREISNFLDNSLDNSSSVTFMISVHTFTPTLREQVRAWDTGLIYDVERPADVLCAEFMMNFLRGEGFLVGDNQPYPPLAGDSLARHATSRDIVGVGIEIRNDLVTCPRGQAEWGERLARAVQGWLRSG